MAKVIAQDTTHYLYPTLDALADSRLAALTTPWKVGTSKISDHHTIGGVAISARLRPHSRSSTPRSPLLQAWRSILAVIVTSWRALTDTERAWYRTNAPAYYKSGYTWYISLNLKAAAQRANWQDGW